MTATRSAGEAFIADPSNASSPLSVPAAKTAVLLLDFHKFVVSSLPAEKVQQALSQASLIRQWAKEHGIIVIHCLLDFKLSTSPRFKMAPRFNAVRDAMAQADATVYAEHEAVSAIADEYTFWRAPGHVSAMVSFGLQEFLQRHAINSLILVGFSASGCVLSTAKDAAEREYVVTVVSDAVSDREDDVQKLVVEKLLVGQCHIIEAQELLRQWGSLKR